MKVIHLIPGIASGGGAENVVRDLCRAIDRARFQLEVWYWNDQDDLAPAIRSAGAEAVRLPLGKVMSFASVVHVARMLKNRRASLVHTHFFDGDLLGFLASRLAGIEALSHVHSHPFLTCARHAWRYRLMGLGLARIVCVSGYVRDHVKAATGLDAGKFEVIHNGIDLDVFGATFPARERLALRAALGFNDADCVIGNVARLIEDKGHAVLLRALRVVMARAPHVKALIVGDGVLADELKCLAHDLGIGQRVVFTGKRHDVAQLLGCMDFFVCPTYREAFGLSVLEAMACGRAVIVSNDAGMPEVVRDQKDGFLLAPGNPDALAQAMGRLVEDPLLARRMGLSAMGRSKEFSLCAMAHKFEGLYATTGRKVCRAW